jgi:hypothetical protein
MSCRRLRSRSTWWRLGNRARPMESLRRRKDEAAMTQAKPWVDVWHPATLQMWRCNGCGAERQWGYGAPEDSNAQPFLLCKGTCSKDAHHPHSFAGARVR